jgi:hypothetical protein
MMESLIAFCVVLLIAAGVVVALAIAVEYLRQLADRRLPALKGWPWPPVPPTLTHSEAPPLVCRRRDHEGQRPPPTAAPDPGHTPEDVDDIPKAPRSAEILPFVRKRARARPLLRVV